MSIVEDMTSEELGFGATLFLWGFRAAATGRSRCWLMEHSFCRAMGQEGRRTLDLLRLMAAEIGLDGRRKISLIPTPCRLVTDDELGLVAAVSAGSTKDVETCKHYISWLMGSRDIGDTLETVCATGQAFTRAGLTVKMPAISLTITPGAIMHPTTALCGAA